MPTASRRAFIASSLATLPMLSAGAEGPSRTEHPQKLHVVCVGGHPDHPESGCGGTLARYAALGHRVTIVYLTRGERGIPGKSLAEAAAIRTAEARHAFPVFYFEVNAGDQTRGFVPTIFVDVGSVRETKKRALVAHVSQDGEAIYRQDHEPLGPLPVEG
jgi:LmbE family N-acetylglucosaminyl deacetylase